MPKKLDSCVKKVKKQGKDESAAYAICSDSTGIKRKKGGGWTKSKSTKDKKTKNESVSLVMFDTLLEAVSTEIEKSILHERRGSCGGKRKLDGSGKGKGNKNTERQPPKKK